MAIPSLRDFSGSTAIKNSLSYPKSNFVLFQMWERIKYADQLMPAKIKQEIPKIEQMVLQNSQYDSNSSAAIVLLIKEVNQLFVNLSQRCDTTAIFGDIIPITKISYLRLGQIWEDQALSALWDQIGEKIPLPHLTMPQKRAWLADPQNAEQLSQVRSLDLSNRNLKIFPLEIRFCSALQTLHLSNNQIAEIPEGLNLPQLQGLYLNKNQLATLPLWHLPLLSALELNDNQLTTLPDLNSSPLLLWLSFNNNQIAVLQDLNLPLLHTLYLNNNQIAAVPDLNTPLLKTLYLNNNRITKLSDLNLPLLEGLYLNNNQLGTLPAFNLPQLRWLFLDNNKIAALPDLNLPELWWLGLNDNQFTALSDLNSPQLQGLLLNNNQIAALPALNLPRLRVIELNGNPLLFISDKDPNALSVNYCMSSMNQFKDYHCKSKLAQFFQCIGLGKLDENSMKSAFHDLEKRDQCLVFEMMDELSGIDLFFGEYHPFDDIGLFYKAIKKAVSVKFDRMSQENQNRVYEKIYDLSLPETLGLDWGKNHAFDHVLRLIDAMAFIESDQLDCAVQTISDAR